MSLLHPPASHRALQLALLAVLWHALMPLWMNVPAPAGIQMEICSVQGRASVFVSFDEREHPAPPPEQAQRCPLCLAGAHFSLTPAAEATPALLAGLRHAQRPPATHLVAALQSGPPYSAHAPPLI